MAQLPQYDTHNDDLPIFTIPPNRPEEQNFSGEDNENSKYSVTIRQNSVTWKAANQRAGRNSSSEKKETAKKLVARRCTSVDSILPNQTAGQNAVLERNEVEKHQSDVDTAL